MSLEVSSALAAAEFLSGAILICLGILVIAATILVLNNIFVKYWKPIRVFTFVPVHDHYVDPVLEEQAAAKAAPQSRK